MTCPIRQNEDGVPAAAGHAKAADEGTVLSAAGDVFQKGPVFQQIRHEILIVHPPRQTVETI